MSCIISEEELETFLDKLDQEAMDDEDEETPNEYYEGVFETTNKIRREFGIPVKKH